ncbi:MAG: hypothetical protein J3R72DRAFT_457678 [Linnemannia gamsii]|nr:MAG: hypothetical protein J3R72DRAFT_457678 [Linnemannia gamsii]
MQTRRQKQVAKTEDDIQVESQSRTVIEDEVMHEAATATIITTTSTDSIQEDEHMEVEEASMTSVPELPVTPGKTRRRLSEPKSAAASPKRMKTKKLSTSTMPSTVLQRSIRTMEIPHSAILTQVVWVFDEKYQWWPGKIKPYPPQNNKAKVTRFGNVKPKTIIVDCVESSVLSFEHASKERFRHSGKLSSHARAFQEAYKEASAEQLKDDDGLPSMDEVFTHLSTLSATLSSPTQKDTVCHKATRADIEYVPDPSLTIPGELVLAQAERSYYYPGRIESFNSKTNKYKIELATGHYPSLERKRFYTRYQREFQTCPMGEMAKELDEDFEDPELESDVVDLYPVLYAIIAGTHDEAGRLKAFLQGGKAMNQLAQRVGPGDFTQGQYSLISRILQSEFLPDLSTTKRIPRLMGRSLIVAGAAAEAGTEYNGPVTTSTGEGGSPMKREGDITLRYSDVKRVHFVTDVLLPETITRLTMRRKGMAYADADKSVLEEQRSYSTDTYWVEDILAARDSFLDGRTA